jgi:hypothetical protein
MQMMDIMFNMQLKESTNTSGTFIFEDTLTYLPIPLYMFYIQYIRNQHNMTTCTQIFCADGITRP